MSINGNLIIVRGVPGAGKSTFAIEKYVKPFNYKLIEADMFFIKDEVYTYDKSKISDAHQWCLSETIKALTNGENVIVANTFTRLWEVKPYLALKPSKIFRCTGNYRNIHDVSDDIVKQMQIRFEDIEGEIII